MIIKVKLSKRYALRMLKEHDWEIFIGGKKLGHEKLFFITKGKDQFGMPILVRFLRLNGQQVKINSIATAKRFITLYEKKERKTKYET